jgi:hypothetical protein
MTALTIIAALATVLGLAHAVTPADAYVGACANEAQTRYETAGR